MFFSWSISPSACRSSFITARLCSLEETTHVQVFVKDSHRGGSPTRRRDIADPLVNLADHALGNAHQGERLLVSDHIADLLVRPRSLQLSKGNSKRNLAIVQEAGLFFHFVRGCDLLRALLVVAVGMKRQFLRSLLQSLLLFLEQCDLLTCLQLEALHLLTQPLVASV
jgi:hypothetical protein